MRKSMNRCLCFFKIILFCLSLITGCSGQNNVDDTALAEVDIPSNKIVFQARTPLIDKEPNRINNIQKAIEKINEVEMNPGEVFSFNDTVGKRVPEKGYKEAVILHGKKKARAVGGGICQLSTTLYQAAMGGKLEIVERHPHQKKIPYAKKDADAAVAYEIFDLKLKNNTQKVLKIQASIDSNHVVVIIYEKC